MSALWVHALVLYVNDEARARAFWGHEMGLPQVAPGVRLPDHLTLAFCAGRGRCTARGPHGLVPALEVDDIARARAYVRARGRPIVFEEVVPGLARFTFLDPEGNAVDMVQTLEVTKWQRGDRIPDVPADHPPRVLGLFEVSLYALDVARAVRFYREQVGLPTGLAYFAHIHLLFQNLPLVIRPTWHRCESRDPHTPALVIGHTPPQKHDPSPRQWYELAPTWEDEEHTRLYLSAF